MPEPLPKVGVLLACLWQMHKLQIHKLVSRYDHLNVSTMYSIFDWKEFELLLYRWVFLKSTKISDSEEPNALEKAPVQFMPLWKLSGKFHFLVWFFTSSWKHTYMYVCNHCDPVWLFMCLLQLQYVPVVQGLLVADPDFFLCKCLPSSE